MEVHAHTHTPFDPDPSTSSGHRGRKKCLPAGQAGTHYFLEFLMLFPAVFIQVSAIAQKLRARDIGVSFDGTPGKFNAITDVKGVDVGYSTIISGEGKNITG